MLMGINHNSLGASSFLRSSRKAAGSITTLLVDADYGSRNRLQELMHVHCPGVNIIGHAASVEEAYMRCGIYHPDLVLIDVGPSGRNLFGLFSRYEHVPFRVLFLISPEHYALQSIRLAALDYVLKPFVISDLQQGIDRVQQKPRPSDERFKLLLRPGNLETIALPVQEDYACILVKAIIYCETHERYTIYHLVGGRKLIVNRTMKESERALRHSGFLRIHSSFLVNVVHIRKFLKSMGGCALMSNGAELPISLNYRDKLMNEMLRV